MRPDETPRYLITRLYLNSGGGHTFTEITSTWRHVGEVVRRKNGLPDYQIQSVEILPTTQGTPKTRPQLSSFFHAVGVAVSQHRARLKPLP